MYHLSPYLPLSDNDVVSFVQTNPLAVVSIAYDSLVSQTIIPVLLRVGEDDRWFLEGHVYRAMDHYTAMEAATRACVLFHGPQAYISAQWYPDPARASTWNYIAVQCSGIIRWMDAAQTKDHLQRLTNQLEPPGSPARFESIPSDYVHNLIPHIAAFEIQVEKQEAVFKLSQDKAPEIQRNIVTQLQQRKALHDATIAQYMQAAQTNSHDRTPTH